MSRRTSHALFQRERESESAPHIKYRRDTKGNPIRSRFLRRFTRSTIPIRPGTDYRQRHGLRHRHLCTPGGVENNLPTIGVLAHGLHTLYPSVHRVTAREAEQNGGLLTEYTTQQPILKINFVARNRIVAGMTEATLVIESPEKGGALITAHLARDYNREVFALPGNINQECSIGCNRLIRDNVAALVTSAKDIIETMGWETATRSDVKQQPSLFPEISEKESVLLQILHERGEMQINQLTVATNLPTGEILSTLLEMEFKGLVRTLPGGMFRTTK